MPSQYLQGCDHELYCSSKPTTQQVVQASLLIDGYLKKPQGLVYVSDANGNPAYLSAMQPELTLTATAGFTPGIGVIVPVTGPLKLIQVGDVVVLDRANPLIAESVQVTSIDTTNNTVTLGSTAAMDFIGVQFSHSAGCTMETGLVLTEQKYLPENRSEVILSHTPVRRIIGGTGRYAYGRRGDGGTTNLDDFNLLAALNTFGGPPVWEIWPANAAAGIDSRTGALWVPAGIMLAYYSEVKVRYVSGFTQTALPAEIKQACAQIIESFAATSGLSGNFKNYKAGDTGLERFSASNLSEDIKSLLYPYRAHEFV